MQSDAQYDPNDPQKAIGLSFFFNQSTLIVASLFNFLKFKI